MRTESSKSVAETRSSPQVIAGLVERFVQKIEKGELQPGQQLPSRNKLAEALGCAPSTVSVAVRDMVRRKLVSSVPGKGIFVREDWDPATRAVTIGIIGWFAGHTNAQLLREDGWWRGIYTDLFLQASKRNCSTLLIPGTDTEPIQVGRILRHRPDVLIVQGVHMMPSTFGEFRRAGLPLIFLASDWASQGVSYVTYDFPGMIRDMVGIFQEHGHQRIGFLALRTFEPAHIAAAREAFYYHLGLHGMAYDYNRYWVEIEVDRSEFRESARREACRAARALLDLPDPPTALYCGNPHMADGVAACAAELGLKIGKDLSLIVTSSFEEDSPYSMFLEPHDLLAEKLVDTARRVVSHPYEICQVVIPRLYIDKGSVGRR